MPLGLVCFICENYIAAERYIKKKSPILKLFFMFLAGVCYSEQLLLFRHECCFKLVLVKYFAEYQYFINKLKPNMLASDEL